VLLVCAALAASATYSFVTLTRLRGDFLDSRGLDLVALLDAGTRGRGPGGRADPAMWQTAVEETLAARPDVVVFLEVLNAHDEVVARAGDDRADAYLLDRPLPTPRRGGQRASGAPAEWRIRAGLDPASTRFISRAANLQLATAAVAIVTLLITAAYLLRTARRFVALRAQESQARRLADLGRMAATLAHEIRNPLGAVKGLTQVAREQITADHGAQQHLQTVVSETERLERLVDDLLRFARPRQVELSRFDLVDAVRQAADTVSSMHPEDGFDVAIEAPTAGGRGNGDRLQVCSDADGIRQVLLNVLLNAAQATGRGTNVSVRLARSPRPRQVEVVVEDDGPGLEGRDPEELFSPFATTKTRGSGLGLAVSRQIVEQLGGAIRLQDRPEGGARCTIVLPTEPAA
jgi:two-component system sensor histidine kinase HydH